MKLHEQHIVRLLIGSEEEAKAFVRYALKLPAVYRAWREGVDSTTFEIIVAIGFLPDPQLRTFTDKVSRAVLYKTMFTNQRKHTYDAFNAIEQQET